MAHGDFVWCDLSAYRPAKARRFYARLLGWRYRRERQQDGSSYHVASTPDGAAGAIFQMPAKFRKIGLPSFWMPYIHVDDAAATCARARGAGGKVEIEPMAFLQNERIALIRDPLGAGFTVYEGTGLRGASLRGAGRAAWRGLYVSRPSAVARFYETLFGWRMAPDPSRAGGFRVHSADGAQIAELAELDASVRGSFEFWGVHFAVDDLTAAEATVQRGGGAVRYRDADGDEPAVLAQDADGAAFFLRETEPWRR